MASSSVGKPGPLGNPRPILDRQGFSASAGGSRKVCWAVRSAAEAQGRAVEGNGVGGGTPVWWEVPPL
jgi:hypothetical protein